MTAGSLNNFREPLKNIIRTARALMMRPAQSIFFDGGAVWVSECIKFSSRYFPTENQERHHVSDYAESCTSISPATGDLTLFPVFRRACLRERSIRPMID